MKIAYAGTIATDPTSPVENRQAPGIGRLAVSGDRIACNNLGKNVSFGVIDGGGRIVWRGRFAATDFPEDEEASEFDLDAHALLWERARDDVTGDGARDRVLFLNHFGKVRLLEAAAAWTEGAEDVVPAFAARWAGDVACAALAGDRLVSAGSAGYHVPDAPTPGILVSGALAALPRPGARPASTPPRVPRHDAPLPGAASPDAPELPREIYLTDLGLISTLAVSSDASLLAIGAGDRLLIVPLVRSGAGPPLNLAIGRPLWERRLGFAPTWCCFSDGGTACWAAGPEPASAAAAAAGEWDRLEGGGFARVDLDGTVRLQRFFVDASPAWGNGGVPFVLAPPGGDASLLCLLRPGLLAAWSSNGARIGTARIDRGPARGIAHLARFGRHVFCGFNRDGYRLHHFRLEE